MKQAVWLVLLALVALLTLQIFHIKKERLQMEQLLWVEFDAGVHGLIRMLRLAETASEGPLKSARPALLAAFEHSRTVARLGPVAEQLLQARGVQAEPLAGYLYSLTGGVASLCGAANVEQVIDRIWIAEIRHRLEQVRENLRPSTLQTLDRKSIQARIDALFGADPASLYYTLPVGLQAPAC